MSASNPAGVAVAEAISRLAETTEAAAEKLLSLPSTQVEGCPAGMTWSRKQVLGHLIDSASNNHQRFVRAQFQPQMSFPRYVQDQWVGAQGYSERPWTELVELWRLYNRHLVHVMKGVPASTLANLCVVSEDEPSSLADHMVDYVLHLQHHLDQILA